jgi:RND family efflux transporter MFP subunit
MRPKFIATLCATLCATLLAACDKTDGGEAASESASKPAAATAVLLISPEDLRTVESSAWAAGPVVTGSLEPDRRADLRAEIAAVVLQVLKDNGEPVRAGDLLVRLDDTAIRDSLTSASEAERAANQAFVQAERQVQRLKTLQAQGMTTTQALEDAELRRNSAQSDLVAARSRVVSARQQQRRTEVRAPFAGVVSERKVSAGDTAQVGKELLKVIDPGSLRFEGLVSADRMHELQAGQAVQFRVNGFPDQEFEGRVRRIDATANAATRQVEVIVDFTDPAGAPRVAGLFAEGRVQAGAAQALTVSESAVLRTGDAAFVWRVQGQAIQKVSVELGERNPRTGDLPVLQGLAAGDRILRNPGSMLVDGQAFEFATPPAGAGSAAAAAAMAGATR